MKHLLSIDQLEVADIDAIIELSATMKRERGNHADQPLAGQNWAMIFNKSSTRTRVSFEVGIRELGGDVLFLGARDLQLGRGEPIKDTARVLGRMVHGAVIRTYAQDDVEDFAHYAQIPTINALTDFGHPCQILTDIFTFHEKQGDIRGKTVAFIGDGACNVCTSWVLAADKLGFNLRVGAPQNYQPLPDLLERVNSDLITCTEDVNEAAEGADLLYTDVWVSMGKEVESAKRIEQLTGYQISQELVKRAAPGALVMHCLPAYRGKEITEEVLEAHADTIFEEAENRLHTQKAILKWIVS